MLRPVLLTTLAAAGIWAATLVQSQENAERRTAWDGVFTAEQAARGQKIFATQCAVCHGETMRGGPGVPGVVGPEFLFNWNGRSAAELYNYLQTSMPPGQPGSLSEAAYADLVAAIFAGNGFTAGESTPLPTDAQALRGIVISRDRP